MHLPPRDLDKLLLVQAGQLAQRRLARGLRLNYPEAIALLSTVLLEFIRDGRSVSELMELGKQILGRNQVLSGIAEMLHEVQLEGTFEDGTKLVTVHHPICQVHGDLHLALYGSFLPAPPRHAFEPDTERFEPGGYALQPGHLELNAGRATETLSVTNTGDRPIQVGSHFPFWRTNTALQFDRARATGMRLDIPAGTALRFEPGDTKTVTLVATLQHPSFHVSTPPTESPEP